jgi:hypothetical protein
MAEPVKTTPDLDEPPKPEARPVAPEVMDRMIQGIIARYPRVMAKLAE